MSELVVRVFEKYPTVAGRALGSAYFDIQDVEKVGVANAMLARHGVGSQLNLEQWSWLADYERVFGGHMRCSAMTGISRLTDEDIDLLCREYDYLNTRDDSFPKLFKEFRKEHLGVKWPDSKGYESFREGKKLGEWQKDFLVEMWQFFPGINEIMWDIKIEDDGTWCMGKDNLAREPIRPEDKKSDLARLDWFIVNKLIRAGNPDVLKRLVEQAGKIEK
jgi:hypothetical protein